MLKDLQKLSEINKNKILGLPPNVNGKNRGFLDIIFDEIIWKSSKNFPAVEIKVIFWGQNTENSIK